MIRFFRSKWLLIITVPAICGLVFAFLKIKLHGNLVNEELTEFENKVAELEKDNGFLERVLSQMTHPSFLEKEARLKLNYKSAGEEVVFVYPDEKMRSSSKSADLSKEFDGMPNPAKWVYYLLGY